MTHFLFNIIFFICKKCLTCKLYDFIWLGWAASKSYKKGIFILFVKGFEFLISTPLHLKCYLDYTQLHLFWSSWHNWSFVLDTIFYIYYIYITTTTPMNQRPAKSHGFSASLSVLTWTSWSHNKAQNPHIKLAS